jgi:hypothetical protein
MEQSSPEMFWSESGPYRVFQQVPRDVGTVFVVASKG